MEITPEEYFSNSYAKEVYESEHFRTSIKQLRVILYAKYEKSYLHKVVGTQCQNLKITQRNELLKLLHKFEYLFDETLGIFKTDPV